MTSRAGSRAPFGGTLLRRTALAFYTNTGAPIFTYVYDASSQLANVNDATYSYLANSPLISQLTYRSNSTTRMTTTKSYDYLNRLLFVGSAPASGAGSGASPLPSLAYQYNDANQRTRVTLEDGSYWLYEYDYLGQLTSGKR